MVLLPETDEAGAGVFVDRVSRAAAAWQGPPGIALSLSMGAATARTRAELEAAPEIADQRMYAAKHGAQQEGIA